jgi:3-methyl-2-oxobutanoate hydroxymethyltransferase
VAERVTEALSVPTIGIGSGLRCDGQVLVLHDLLGLYEGRPARFVKRYAEVGDTIRDALERFAADVRAGAFPEEAHTYAIPGDELAAFERGLAPPGG